MDRRFRITLSLPRLLFTGLIRTTRLCPYIRSLIRQMFIRMIEPTHGTGNKTTGVTANSTGEGQQFSIAAVRDYPREIIATTTASAAKMCKPRFDKFLSLTLRPSPISPRPF